MLPIPPKKFWKNEDTPWLFESVAVEPRQEWLDQAERKENARAREAEDAAILAEQMAVYEAQMAQYAAYGEWLVGMIPYLLGNLGLRYIRKYEEYGTPEEDRTTYVVIDWFTFDWWAYYLWINTMRLPSGVTYSSFLEPENKLNIEKTLELNLGGRKVEIEYSSVKERQGLWILVYHKDRQNKLPAHVKFYEAFDMLPGNTNLEIPAGFGEGGAFYYIDLYQHKHLLVGGVTGSGKSVFLNNMLSCLLLSNTPETLRLFLVDMKKGVEFFPYIGLGMLGGDTRFYIDKGKQEKYLNELMEELEMDVESKDLFTKGFITVDDNYKGKGLARMREPLFAGEVIDKPYKLELMFDYVAAEIERRAELFKERGIRNISAWNKKRSLKKMSVWLIVIDEFAELLNLSSKEVNILHRKVASIAAIARAFGIHLIVCTQHPSSDVVPGIVKANLPATVAFYCSYEYQSRALLGNMRAKKELENHPGQAFFDDTREQTMIQTPFISNHLNKTIIQKTSIAIEEGRKAEVKKYSIDPGEMWEYVLETQGGYCPLRVLRNRFSPHSEIMAILKDYEVQVDESGQFSPIIEIEEQQFVLAPAKGGPISRQLIKLSKFKKDYDKEWKSLVSGSNSGLQSGDSGSNGDLSEYPTKPLDIPDVHIASDELEIPDISLEKV